MKQNIFHSSLEGHLYSSDGIQVYQKTGGSIKLSFPLLHTVLKLFQTFIRKSGKRCFVE